MQSFCCIGRVAFAVLNSRGSFTHNVHRRRVAPLSRVSKSWSLRSTSMINLFQTSFRNAVVIGAVSCCVEVNILNQQIVRIVDQFYTTRLILDEPCLSRRSTGLHSTARRYVFPRQQWARIARRGRNRVMVSRYFCICQSLGARAMRRVREWR